MFATASIIKDMLHYVVQCCLLNAADKKCAAWKVTLALVKLFPFLLQKSQREQLLICMLKCSNCAHQAGTVLAPPFDSALVCFFNLLIRVTFM